MMDAMAHRAVPDEIIEAQNGRPEIIIRRSARRRRTLSARMEGTSVLVMVPLGMSKAGQDRQVMELVDKVTKSDACLLYTSPSPRDRQKSRMPSSA